MAKINLNLLKETSYLTLQDLFESPEKYNENVTLKELEISNAKWLKINEIHKIDFDILFKEDEKIKKFNTSFVYSDVGITKFKAFLRETKIEIDLENFEPKQLNGKIFAISFEVKTSKNDKPYLSLVF